MAFTVIEYEKLILSLILRNASPASTVPRKICSELSVEKFSVKEHKILYRSIKRIVEDSDIPDIATISAYFEPEKFKEIGGEPYLRSLQNFISVANIDESETIHKTWVRVVDVAGRCRLLASVISRYNSKLSQFETILPTLLDEGKIEMFLEEFLREIQQSGMVGQASGYVKASSLYEAELERLADELSGKPRDVIPIGWPSFHELRIPRRGVLNVIAGLTGTGKTTFAALMALGAAFNIYFSEATAHVAYNCMEDSKEELYRRWGCALSNVDNHKFLARTVSKDELERYTGALKVINMLPLYIDDTAGITSNELRLQADLLRMQQGAGPRVMGVSDYSELFGDSGKDERTKLAEIARNLHRYARDRNSAELLLTQYPELGNAEQIGGMKSKEARAIGQAGKVFMEVWNLKELHANRAAQPNFRPEDGTIPDWANPDYAYVFLHKNSGGKKTRIPMEWNSQFTQFKDLKVQSKDQLFDF